MPNDDFRIRHLKPGIRHSAFGIAEACYQRAPVWLQHLFVSAQGFDFRYRRADQARMRAEFDFLLGSETWSAEEYHRYQVRRLQALLRVAFARVPYYRELQKGLGCFPGDFKEPEDIRGLPVLERSQVRGQEHLFVDQGFDLRNCRKASTSGTTGAALTHYDTRDGFSRRWAFVARLRHWAGLSDPFYPRRAQFTGRPIIPANQGSHSHVYWRRNRPGNAVLFSAMCISPETVPFYAEALREFRPEVIDGYPSALLAIARVSRNLGTRLPVPRALMVTAETLRPGDREELEQAFGCRVFNQYASSEPSCYWCDCEHGTMHVNPEYGISEIIRKDGTPADCGEPGEVVVTSFLNPVMFLVRYRVGDIAVPGPKERCACGRDMPRINRIEGRTNDIIYVPGRGYIGVLAPVFWGLEGIVEGQIVQEELKRIRVLIVPGPGCSQDTETGLVRNLHDKLGHGVAIEVERVNRIARGANGKFRPVVSRVRHLYPDNMKR